MRDIIKDYEHIVVQLHTPEGSGSGFIVKDKNLIVTNRHVIHGSEKVIIRGEHFDKTLTTVLYTDPLNDLAFLRIPDNYTIEKGVNISNETVAAGDKIMAIGHPMGLRFTATQGIVSKAERKFNNVDYIQVDAAINPGNSGGPLINENGEIVGVNTFIYRDGESLGFALPSTKLNQVLEEFEEKSQRNAKASKCSSCSNIVTEITIQDGYCPHCGNKFDVKEFETKEYIPSGVSATIENILKNIGKEVELSRIGKDGWDIEEGSALIKLYYNNRDGFIYADATLGSLPKENIHEMYEFMLRENYSLSNLSFSVSQQNVLLSTIIYYQDLSEETGSIIFKELFEKADHYDDYLKDTYGMELAEKE